MGKIIYSSNFYLGEGITTEKLDKIKKKIEKKPLMTDFYLIALAGNEKDLLDIYSSRYLGQKYYENHIPYVCGIADNHGDAVTVVEQIVQDCLKERGDLRIREFILEK